MTFTPNSIFYVTNDEGTSKMTFSSIMLAVQGGMNLDDVTITNTEEEAADAHRKYKAVKTVISLMNRMNADQVEQVALLIQMIPD